MQVREEELVNDDNNLTEIMVGSRLRVQSDSSQQLPHHSHMSRLEQGDLAVVDTSRYLGGGLIRRGKGSDNSSDAHHGHPGFDDDS